jgi:16S rRNA (guanine966-N2)-methyltransferase
MAKKAIRPEVVAGVYRDQIIAGAWRGRVLTLPVRAEVRPTRNRIRQAAFNLLGARVEFAGQTVLDLCCGSGAWGLEALSRGASHAWLVDTDPRGAAENVRALGTTAATVVSADATTWTPPAPASLVLADPPYGTAFAQELIGRAQLLGAPGSWWCVETAATTALQWPGFGDVLGRDYGSSRLWVARLEG